MNDGTANAPLTCTQCGASFSLSDKVREKYPNWVPKTCMRCRPAPKGQAPRSGTSARSGTPGRGRGAPRPSPAGVEENLTVAEVLERYHDGPQDGVFTDGSSIPNPGPGGWGAVYVIGGEVVAERHGHERNTTNNRMELTALIAAYDLVPAGKAAVIYTDSNLAVQTINEWAAGWEKRGWTRKTGPIQNLDLVQTLYARAKARPELELRWIKAHAGNRWNEYADSLATAWLRDTL